MNYLNLKLPDDLSRAVVVRSVLLPPPLHQQKDTNIDDNTNSKEPGSPPPIIVSIVVMSIGDAATNTRIYNNQPPKFSRRADRSQNLGWMLGMQQSTLDGNRIGLHKEYTRHR